MDDYFDVSEILDNVYGVDDTDETDREDREDREAELRARYGETKKPRKRKKRLAA